MIIEELIKFVKEIRKSMIVFNNEKQDYIFITLTKNLIGTVRYFESILWLKWDRIEILYTLFIKKNKYKL